MTRNTSEEVVVEPQKDDVLASLNGNVGEPDMVNHPPHYTQHGSGLECIEVASLFGFVLGNAIKYLWRSGKKGSTIQDFEKARWYILRHYQSPSVINLKETEAVSRKFAMWVARGEPSYQDSLVLRLINALSVEGVMGKAMLIALIRDIENEILTRSERDSSALL